MIITKKPLNPNAKMALDQMKLEIAQELNSTLTATGKVGGTMTRKLVEMGEKQLIEDDKDTFYPI